MRVELCAGSVSRLCPRRRRRWKSFWPGLSWRRFRWCGLGTALAICLPLARILIPWDRQSLEWKGGIQLVKAELVAVVAEKAGLKKSDAARVVDAMLTAVQDELAGGGKVALAGFGTFEVRRRGPRQGRNIRTGEVISVPASQVPVFRAGRRLKEAVAGA